MKIKQDGKGIRRCGHIHLIAMVLSLTSLAAFPARLPLTITEVMSSAAPNCLGVVVNHPDFWELTNFGVTNLALGGFRFRDTGNPDGAEVIAAGVEIGPGQSILFVRDGTSITTAAAFAAWWGLPESTNIYFYASTLGFNNDGEELWLWDAETNLVDYVVFGAAPAAGGVTFTFNELTGHFGEFSELGVCGAFRTPQCDDLGSPGLAQCGPIDVAITMEPLTQSIDVGSSVTFSIQANGLPQPAFEWYFNGLPLLTTAGAAAPFPTVVNYAGSGPAWKLGPKPTDLVISDVTPHNAGDYYAVLDNGLQRMTSAIARLTVNTVPTPPRADVPPDECRWPDLRSTLSFGDIVDLPALAEQLKQAPTNTLSYRLKCALSESNQALLDNYPGSTSDAVLQAALVNHLNDVMHAHFPLFVNCEGCELIAVRPETQALLDPLLPELSQGRQALVSNRLLLDRAVQLNRRLLEDAYPTALLRSDPLIVAPGQIAELSVLARGYPAPTYQWSWSANGATYINLGGETQTTLRLPNVEPANAGIYRVRIGNAQGVTNAYARLIVQPKPQLKITEAMGVIDDPTHADWWELTNIGDEPVPLYGFRWDDRPGTIGAGSTVTNAFLLQPGESVIFFNHPFPEEFIGWWGADNLPPNLKVVTYDANGLSEFGDSIHLWNPTATVRTDEVDALSFSSIQAGFSYWFRPNDPCSELGYLSVAGQCGAFSAAEGHGIGSPGWTDWTPPCFTQIRQDGPNITLQWKAQPGSLNRLLGTSSFATNSNDTVWTSLGEYRFAGATGSAAHAGVARDRQYFYRLERVATNDCPCVLDPF